MTATTASAGGGALTGTVTLARFMLRQDRIRIPAWVLGLTLFTVGASASFPQNYPTAAARRTVAATMDSPASLAMVGVNHGGVDGYTYGAMVSHQMLAFSTLLAALMSVLLIVRHTRTEEATGRAELVRGSVVGRHAATTAALVVVVVANLALAALLAAGLGASGIETVTWDGSLLFGAAHAAVGVVFAGIAAVTVQVTEHPRGASGLAMAALGLAYGLRAVGDAGNGTLSWLSPIGWAQATRAYVDDRWWPLLVAVAATALLVAAAFALSLRRDVGAGLRAPRPGTPEASDALATPFGFALRLHRASMIGWAVAMFVLGTMYGSVLGDVEQMLGSNEAMTDMLAAIGGADVVETFAALVTTIMAIIAAIYAVIAAQRMRSEETAGRAEPVLATGLSRTRWVASHLAVVMVGSVVVLLAGGLGLGLAGAAATEDAGLIPRLLGAALAYAPALWLTVGAVVALYGLRPRVTALAWIIVGYSFLVSYLGAILQFPEWTNNLSPFGHVPQLPVNDLTVAPLVALTAIAAGLAAIGLAVFRQRDLQSPA